MLPQIRERALKMIASKSLPIHPFWRFSVKIYSSAVVERSLLKFQNERGLNVNIVLFCIWYAFCDQGRLNKAEIKQILTRIQYWHDLVVVPLRRIRQQLKEVSNSPWPAIRQDILKNELVCEQIEQLLFLDDFVNKTKPVKNNTQRLIDICKNIAMYSQLLRVYFDEKDCHEMGQILSVIFSKIDQETVLRYCIDHLIVKELQGINLKAQLLLNL
jgi:uncharacterized protein (TIGR02444 family)